MSTRNEIYRFDFTIDAEQITVTDAIKFLNLYCKKWVFQEEKADTGWLHYQGRISLIKKKRLQCLIKMKMFGDVEKPIHWSATMIETKGFDYVMKENSRINGPWKDSDKPKYIPRQYRGKMERLRPFQKFIVETAYHFDDRIINVLIQPEGDIGKSQIASLCELFCRGIDLPPCNDADKLIQSCCNICMKKNVRNPSPIFIDLPRSFPQDKMYGLFTAIEQIKKGKLYDMRYNYTEWWIDSPVIWVFTNNDELDFSMLSKGRWKLWEVDKKTYEIRKWIRGFEALACNTDDKSSSNPCTPYNLTVGATGADAMSDVSDFVDYSFL